MIKNKIEMWNGGEEISYALEQALEKPIIT